MGDFATNFIDAYSKGQAAQRARRINQQEQEDRDIEKQLLQHRIKQIKIDEKLQARQAAAQNLALAEGQPEDSYPKTPLETSPYDASGGGIPQQVTGGGAPDVPTMQIPGVEELGVPGMSRKPLTMEEQLGQAIYKKRAELLATPRVIPQGGVLTVDGQVVAKGQPRNEPLVAYTTRDADGTEHTEHITAAEAAQRGPAVKAPLPRRPSGGGGNAVSQEDIDANADGVLSGNIDSLDITGNTGNAIKIRAALQKRGFELAKHQTEARVMRARIRSLTQPDMMKIAQSIEGATNALADVRAANDAIKKSGKPWSAYTGEDKKNLDNSITQFRSSIATLIQLSGGSGAVNKDMTDVGELLSKPWMGSMDSQIDRAAKALVYRSSGFKAALNWAEKMGITPGSGTTEETPGAAPGGKPGVGGSSPGAGKGGGPTDAQIAAALSAKGYPSDPAAVAKAKGSDVALKQLGLVK